MIESNPISSQFFFADWSNLGPLDFSASLKYFVRDEDQQCVGTDLCLSSLLFPSNSNLSCSFSSSSLCAVIILQVYYLWLAYTDWTNQVYLHFPIRCQAKLQSWQRHLLVKFSIKPLIFSFLPWPPSSEKCNEVTNCSGSMPQITLALSKGYIYWCWWEIPLSWLLYPPLWTITLSETNGWKDRLKFLWRFAFFLLVIVRGQRV